MPYLKDEAIAFMAQLGDKVSEEPLRLRQGPKIFASQAEGFLIVPIKPCWLLRLQAPLNKVSLLRPRADYVPFQQMPPFLHSSMTIKSDCSLA